MAMIRVTPGRVRVTVYDTRIAAAFLPGGQVWRNMQRVAATGTAYARAGAPKRSLELMRSISNTVTPRGRNRAQATLVADAPHARFVVNGTTGPIRARGGTLNVRLAPHSYYSRPTPGVEWRGRPGVLRGQVRGQAANDFMYRALRRAMHTHGLR